MRWQTRRERLLDLGLATVGLVAIPAVWAIMGLAIGIPVSWGAFWLVVEHPELLVADKDKEDTGNGR